MRLQRQTLEEKTDLIQKVNDVSKNEKISIKEACKRLEIPYWKYFNALKSLKSGKKKTRAEGKAAPSGGLRVELAFKGDAAKLIREYAETYGVEPEVVCRIMLIDALKEKKKPIPR